MRVYKVTATNGSSSVTFLARALNMPIAREQVKDKLYTIYKNDSKVKYKIRDTKIRE